MWSCLKQLWLYLSFEPIKHSVWLPFNAPGRQVWGTHTLQRSWWRSSELTRYHIPCCNVHTPPMFSGIMPLQHTHTLYTKGTRARLRFYRWLASQREVWKQTTLVFLRDTKTRYTLIQPRNCTRISSFKGAKEWHIFELKHEGNNSGRLSLWYFRQNPLLHAVDVGVF